MCGCRSKLRGNPRQVFRAERLLLRVSFLVTDPREPSDEFRESHNKTQRYQLYDNKGYDPFVYVPQSDSFRADAFNVE